MKKTLTLIFAIITMAVASQAFAQSARIVTTVSTEKHDPAFALGRDFWFAPGQNYLDEQGKYLRIYITSPNKTTAYVASGGIARSITIPAYGIGTFNVPLSWEMKSSGIVEDKGIHVYDPTDDIAVYFMSHNPYTSDGMYCIPTIGWGNDYVIASYESLFESTGNYVYDFPSEFTVSADQDNTIVEITPSCDFRETAIYPENNSVVAYPKGVKFEVTLNRGQCIQFQAVQAQDSTIYDVTGTIVHTNVPVGVVGASMCSNIPTGFSSCDYTTDMIPPIRTWGETYYTTNPVQPDSLPTHDSSMYLIIGTRQNQDIHRVNAATGDHIVFSTNNFYDHFWTEAADANKWYSNEPFLLVQYFNSGSYPDNVLGNGDPAQVVIPAKENFPKTVYTIAPPSVGTETAFNNYANLIVNNNDVPNVTYDGKPIVNYAHQPVDSTVYIYIVPSVQVGGHVVKSDSGVGVYLYGYGNDETFAWEGPSSVGTFNSPDTVPPKVIISGECFTENIHITDSGFLPGNTTQLQSGLNEIRLDSDINMAYLPLPYPEWIDGAQFDTSGISMFVIDPTIPAKLVVSIFDAAGNRTTVTSIFTPDLAYSLSADTINFQPVEHNGGEVSAYFTMTNTSSKNVLINSPELAGQSSASFSFLTIPPVNTPVPDTLFPGQSFTVIIIFDPTVSADSVQEAAFQMTTVACGNDVQVQLIGRISNPNSVVENIATPSVASIVELEDGKSIHVTIPSGWPPPVRLYIYNILGESVYSSSFDATATFDLGELPRGVYFYRLREGEISQTGKIILGQ